MSSISNFPDAQNVSSEVLESQLDWYIHLHLGTRTVDEEPQDDPCVTALQSWVERVGLIDLFNFHMDMMGYDALVIRPLPKAA